MSTKWFPAESCKIAANEQRFSKDLPASMRRECICADLEVGQTDRLSIWKRQLGVTFYLRPRILVAL